MDFSRFERSEKGQILVFCYFSQNWYYNVSLFYAYSFLGMILIDCQDIDFIELFKRLFSRLEMLGLVHFPIIIDIIIICNEVLPKFIASCTFFVVKPILS